MKILFRGSASYRQDEPIRPVCWPHHDLVVVRQGEAIMVVAGQSWSLTEGQGILIPAHTAFHGRAVTSDCRLWVQHFKPTAQEARRWPWLASAGLLSGRTDEEWPRALMARLSQVGRDQNLKENEGPFLLLLLLNALGPIAVTQPAETSESERMMRTLWRDLDAMPPPWPNVDGLAAKVGWSRSYFIHQFRQHLGITPGVWLRKRRLELARRWLRETAWPIREIAVRLGYADQVALHHAFVTAFGETPGSYRSSRPRVI